MPLAMNDFRNLMSRKFPRRRVGVLAVVAAFAALGGLDVALVTSGSAPAPQRAVPVAAQATPVPSSQAPASPPGPADVPSGAVTTVPAPPVVETTPPVVDGVRRGNVGSAHSPKLLQQLATSPATMPPPAEAGALGVDVADYQHPGGAAIAWSQVAAAGYRFAFIKATEGDYYANPYHASDLVQAKAAGLYATGYHFAIPNVSDGASQADYAVGNGGYAADGHTLPLALDIEYNPYGPECYGLSATAMVAWLSAFTAEEQRLTGQPPIIYSTADWWDTCTGDSTAFGADPLWVAGYTSGSPPMPAGWGSWTFWQYTSRGSVPGITGHVDVSYFLQAAVRLLDPGSQQDARGTAVQLQVASLNAAGGQSLQFAASGLPPGLSISGSGLITGTIAAAATGTYEVTVTATSSGAAGSVSFPWTVTTSQPAPPATPPAAGSASPSLLPSAGSPSPTVPLSASPADTASPSPAASPSPSVSPSPSPSGSPSTADSPSPTDSPSPPASPSPAASASACASPSGSPSPSPSVSPSPGDSACACPSPSPSPSGSPSPSPSAPVCTSPSGSPPASPPVAATT
jgi:GH25 family lysozyme M1 (1,4-beta-N-acetylmuramidase)